MTLNTRQTYLQNNILAFPHLQKCFPALLMGKKKRQRNIFFKESKLIGRYYYILNTICKPVFLK